MIKSGHMWSSVARRYPDHNYTLVKSSFVRPDLQSLDTFTYAVKAALHHSLHFSLCVIDGAESRRSAPYVLLNTQHNVSPLTVGKCNDIAQHLFAIVIFVSCL